MLDKKIIVFYVAILAIYSSFVIAGNDFVITKAESVKESPIRIVMSAAFVSEDGVDVYNDIFRYLGKKLNRKVEFVSGFSYDVINNMLDAGLVDVGFLCGLPYVIKKDTPEPSINLLLAPVMKDKKYQNKPIYYSYFIVNKNSKYKEFIDTKGSHFVFSDNISNSGYNMPRDHLINIGEINGYFGKLSRSGSHEESIRLVALGKADITAVDSLMYDYDVLNNSKYISQTRILKILGPSGIPPIVVSKNTPLALQKTIQKILVDMKNNSQGRTILDKALVDRFVIVNDSNYDDIREMKQKSINVGYEVIR